MKLQPVEGELQRFKTSWTMSSTTSLGVKMQKKKNQQPIADNYSLHLPSPSHWRIQHIFELKLWSFLFPKVLKCLFLHCMQTSNLSPNMLNHFRRCAMSRRFLLRKDFILSFLKLCLFFFMNCVMLFDNIKKNLLISSVNYSYQPCYIADDV